MLIKISLLTSSSRVPSLCWKPGSGLSVMNLRDSPLWSDFPLRAPCPLQVTIHVWGARQLGCSEDTTGTGVPGLHGEMSSRTHAGGTWAREAPCQPGAFLHCPPKPEKFLWPFGGSQRDCRRSTNQKIQPPVGSWLPWGHFSSLSGFVGSLPLSNNLAIVIECSR